MKAFLKVLNVIVDVLIILVLVMSMFIVVISLTTKNSGVPNIFGIAPLSVQSDSMEDTLNTGDLIFSQVTNDPEREYKVGDIVSFGIKINNKDTFNTHRIVEVIEDDTITYYRTKGDNKPDPDAELLTSGDIVAVYTGAKIPVAGSVITYLQDETHFFLCILLPMILFFAYEAVRVVMNIVAYNKEKAIAQAQEAVQNAELTEEQKQKAIEEYLASLGEKSEEKTVTGVQTPASDIGEEAPKASDSEE